MSHRDSSHRPHWLVTDVIYPTVERLVDFVFLASLPILIMALAAGAVVIAQKRLDLATLSLLIVLAASVGVYARYIAPYRLRVTRLQLDSQNTQTRVVFFSDLHVGRFKRAAWAQKVVDLINAQQPDLILFGGDFYGHPHRSDTLAKLLAPLSQLRAPLGVFAVFGNHDHGLHDVANRADELRDALPPLNIRVLTNESAQVTPRLRVVGIGELWVNEHAERETLDALLAPSDMRTIVIGHNPDLMQLISPRADIFLFGHTHAGQIYIPLFPSLGVPVRGNLYRGWHMLPQGAVYISAGCGEASTPTRLGTHPEIVVFEI